MTKVRYKVLLRLKYPQTSYVLTNLCEGINIEDSFFEAVEPASISSAFGFRYPLWHPDN